MIPNRSDRSGGNTGVTATEAESAWSIAGSAIAIALLVLFAIGCGGTQPDGALSTGSPAGSRTISPPTAGTTPSTSLSAQPRIGATAEVVIDGTSYARSGGSCRGGEDQGTYHWALTFIGPGTDYFSILVSSDSAIADGSYGADDMISTLKIEGVADYNVRVTELNLGNNVSQGDFTGTADAGRITITGTFAC
jgi:hypothetical protein